MNQKNMIMVTVTGIYQLLLSVLSCQMKFLNLRIMTNYQLEETHHRIEKSTLNDR